MLIMIEINDDCDRYALA